MCGRDTPTLSRLREIFLVIYHSWCARRGVQVASTAARWISFYFFTARGLRGRSRRICTPRRTCTVSWR